MSKWVEMTDFERKEAMSDLEKLIEENINEDRGKLSVTRIRNALIRNGLRNKSDICEMGEKEIFKMRGLGGPQAKAVIRNIRSNYDEMKVKKERLAEIDETINRLLNEKVMILKSLD